MLSHLLCCCRPPSPPLAIVEDALRAALPLTSALPSLLCADLLQEPRSPADEAEAAADAMLLQHKVALPQRPYVRHVASNLLRWAELRRFPLPAAPTPPDLVEIVSRDHGFEALTPQVEVAVEGVCPERLRALLERLGPPGILALLGCRISTGTAMQAPPEPRALVRAFDAPHTAGSRHAVRLSVGARALSKHWIRSGGAFWGTEHSGNEEPRIHAYTRAHTHVHAHVHTHMQVPITPATMAPRTRALASCLLD